MAKKYPALFLLIFVVVGILIAELFRIRNYLFLTVLVGISFGGLLLFHYQKIQFSIFCFSIALLCFSGFRFAVNHYDYGLNHVSRYADGKTRYIIYGKISDWVDLKPSRTEMKVAVDSIEASGMYYPRGRILVKINTITTAFQRNDRVVLRGRIYPVPARKFSSEFDYNRYLSWQGISGTVYVPTTIDILVDKGNRYSLIRITEQVRNIIRNSFYRNLSEQSAALASGFLIGETRDISPQLYEQFKVSGTLHLLAVSGSNVVLVLAFFIYLLRPVSLSRQKESAVLIGVVLLFTLLSYSEPSVVRASIMAVLVLAARLFQRRYNLVHIISLTAFIILLYEPSQLFDIGFQLSFVIAWGLIVTVPPISRLFEKHHQKSWYKFIVLPFLISFVAQLFSFGLVGLYFKQVPVLSPLANLIIVPLVSFLVLGVLVLLVADFIFPLFGLFIGSLLNMIFKGTVSVVVFFGSEIMPLIRFERISWIDVGLYYLLLFILPFTPVHKRLRRIVVIILILSMTFVSADALMRQLNHERYLKVHAFSVPGGVAVVVEKPDKSSELILTSLEAKEYEIDKKILIPELQKRQINSISSLLLLQADYKALDDVIRLVECFNTESVYLDYKLKASFTDISVESGEIRDDVRVRYLHEQFNFQSAGYYPVKNGLILRLTGANLYVTEQVDFDILDRIEADRPLFLFLGNIWNMGHKDWQRLKKYPAVEVICSKSVQIDGDESLISTENSTISFFDIYTEGAYLIRLKK